MQTFFPEKKTYALYVSIIIIDYFYAFALCDMTTKKFENIDIDSLWDTKEFY